MTLKDDLTLLMEALKKREEILQKGQSVSKYNHYFDRMIQYAKQLIEANRQDEIAPFLESDSISIRYDVACILFHHYPDLCTQVLREIADMTFENGMPKYLAIISTGARCTLEYGIPL
ncbi:MAG: hypothetical protein E7503_05820 [Ruminococcus sp.]|nr:hypothetical protein [Ruminococcus sp.]